MTKSKPHSCESCKGTGKVVSQKTRVRRGVQRTYEFVVDCPGKLAGRFLLDLPEAGSGKKSRTG